MSDAGGATVSYDGETVYVRLRDTRTVFCQEFGDLRNVDYDSEGRVVGVELIGRPGDLSLLGLPEADRVRDALWAHGFRIGGDPMFIPGLEEAIDGT